MMEMKVTLPGGKRANAHYKGFTVETCAPKSEGGDGTAPAPFDLLLASIGTCAAVYIAYFCESRDLPTEDISLTLRFQWNEKKHLLDKVEVLVHLPPDFPKQYRKAVIRTAQMCSVKKTFAAPPEIIVSAA